MLNVVFNASAIRPPYAGIGHYSHRVLEQLVRHPMVSQINCISGLSWINPQSILHKDQNRSNRSSGLKKFAKTIPFARELVRTITAMRFSSQLNRMAGHVYLEPNYIPITSRLPAVPVIHDLSHLRYPQYHTKERVKWLLDGLPSVVEHCQKILTVSRFSKQEIVSEFDVPPEKIIIAEPGVTDSFFDIDRAQISEVLRRYELQTGYLLSVGTLEPRKNLLGLMQAFAALPKALRANHPLVLVGGAGWQDKDIDSVASDMEKNGEVKRLGYVAQRDMPFLYAGSAGFAYISFYEGFGLPLLEAMASGIPVLTSSLASMPEVVADAALTVDPHDIKSVTEKLGQLLEDTSFKTYASIHGPKRARNFSWERTTGTIVKTLASLQE